MWKTKIYKAVFIFMTGVFVFSAVMFTSDNTMNAYAADYLISNQLKENSIYSGDTEIEPGGGGTIEIIRLDESGLEIGKYSASVTKTLCEVGSNTSAYYGDTAKRYLLIKIENNGSSFTFKALADVVDDNKVSKPQENNTCDHDYEWTTINDATEDYEGLEVCRCTKCGAVCASRSIPKLSDNFSYVTEKYIKQYEQAKSGQTIKLDLQNWNSIPKAFFEELAKRRDITTTIRFIYNHKVYEFTIERGQSVDTSVDYYGPEKLIQLYGAKEVVTK